MTETDEQLCDERRAMLKARRRGVSYSLAYIGDLQVRMQEMTDRLYPPCSPWFYAGSVVLSLLFALAILLFSGVAS